MNRVTGYSYCENGIENKGKIKKWQLCKGKKSTARKIVYKDKSRTLLPLVFRYMQICYLFLKVIRESNVKQLYLAVTTFSNFQRGVLIFSLNYTVFVHETSHIRPSKYDFTSGIKSSICLKKKLGYEVVDWNKHL